MKCSKCGSPDTKVLESRLTNEGNSVRRRRACLSCNFRYTTYEKEEELVFNILKSSGNVEPYLRDKALRSIQIACQKRPVKLEEIEFMLSQVEKKILEKNSKLIPSKELGDMIMKNIHDLDKVAYVRFASVYKDFKDPQEFLKILSSLEESPATKDS